MVSEEGVGPFLLGHEREGVGFLVRVLQEDLGGSCAGVGLRVQHVPSCV